MSALTFYALLSFILGVTARSMFLGGYEKPQFMVIPTPSVHTAKDSMIPFLILVVVIILAINLI